MSSPILPFTEANSKRVASLFRRALRTAFDNNTKFDAYRTETIKIRHAFESNKDITDPTDLDVVFTKAEAKLNEWKSPDPYIPPLRPGGTKYQRNIPKPNEECVPGDW
ncbi:uncharacterized protein PRCAT00006213001 [Priceomyces carsonii]|uniref:uncharacterized protein n=1 Tax=Priceomyces carsonii TaxID=28549 RepID=UPI002ED81B50|nr:unnamed protein product [Priceomyces carsonii]